MCWVSDSFVGEICILSLNVKAQWRGSDTAGGIPTSGCCRSLPLNLLG